MYHMLTGPGTSLTHPNFQNYMLTGTMQDKQYLSILFSTECLQSVLRLFTRTAPGFSGSIYIERIDHSSIDQRCTFRWLTYRYIYIYICYKELYSTYEILPPGAFLIFALIAQNEPMNVITANFNWNIWHFKNVVGFPVRKQIRKKRERIISWPRTLFTG